MLRLTLYKNCVITKSYNNVFAYQKSVGVGNSTFEKYLALLNKKSYDVDDVYQEDSGQFIFELSTNDYNSIYEFNYMKIETLDNDVVNDKFIRFAFIDEIVIKNEVAILNYSLDYYHSFIRSVGGINYSLLKGLRVSNASLINPSYKLLPIDYAGNNKLAIYSYGGSSGSEHAITDKVSIILELQVYNTEQYGNATKGFVKYAYMSARIGVKSDYSLDENVNFAPTFSSATQYLEDIIQSKTQKYFLKHKIGSSGFTPTSDDWYYFRIGHVYVLPYNANLEGLFLETQSDTSNVGTIMTDIAFTGYKLGYKINFIRKENSKKLTTLRAMTGLPHNLYKAKGLGYYSKIIPIEYNGTSVDITEFCYVDEYSFRTFLNIQNKIVETTDCFEYNIPLTQLDGEVLAQQKISRVLEETKSDAEKGQIIRDFIGTGLDTINNMRQAVGNGGRGLVSIFSNNASEIGRGMQQFSNAMWDMRVNVPYKALASFQSNISKSKVWAVKRMQIDAPVYNSTVFTSANNIAILNARYDLCEFYIVADNENYVKETINNCGYTVFEMTNNFAKLGLDSTTFTTLTNANYNFIQFGNIDIYGSFPSSVAEILNTIFISGIKVWYDEYMRTDNYV